MSDMDSEMQILREDVKALKARVIIERDIADYWYNRLTLLEGTAYD